MCVEVMFLERIVFNFLNPRIQVFQCQFCEKKNTNLSLVLDLVLALAMQPPQLR